MRRRSLAVALVLTLALLVGATPEGAAAGPYEFAVGGGTDFLGIHYAFAAHQNSSDPPTGHVVVRDVGPGGAAAGQARIQGPVVCLTVLPTPGAQQAYVVFRITKTTDPVNFPAGSFATLIVIDTGEPSSGNLLFDAVGLRLATSAEDCLGGRQQNLRSGNVVVRDALSAPVPSPVMTDNATYRIDEQHNLYIMTENGWELVR